MVWTREVIAERLRRIVSEEHGTGVIELADVFERIFAADFKVLRGELVCEIDGFRHVFADNNCTEIFDGFFNNVFS